MSKKQIVFTVNEETAEKADRKLQHGERSERLREEMNRIAYGERVTEKERVQEKVRDLRKERRDIDAEIDDLQDDRDELDRQIDRAESRLNDLAEQDGEYDGVLAMLEEDLRNGVRILPGAPKVGRAAEIGDCSRGRVIGDLRDRNQDTPDMAFRKAGPNEEPNWRDEQDIGEPVIIEHETKLDGETINRAFERYKKEKQYRKTGSTNGGHDR